MIKLMLAALFVVCATSPAAAQKVSPSSDTENIGTPSAGRASAAVFSIPPSEWLSPKLRSYGYFNIREPGISKPSSAVEKVVLADMLSMFYPSTSIRLRETGTSTVGMCVDVEGVPHDIVILQPSGHERLDEATLTLMRSMPLNPAILDDSPVPFCGYSFSVVWELPS